MPTSYAQARLQLDRKVSSQSNKEEDKKKPKMTIESDEDYYDKQQFKEAMQPQLQKVKQTDDSRKKSSVAPKQEVMPSKNLNFAEESDEEDIFAQMNQVSKSEKKKEMPQPVKKKEMP